MACNLAYNQKLQEFNSEFSLTSKDQVHRESQTSRSILVAPWKCQQGAITSVLSPQSLLSTWEQHAAPLGSAKHQWHKDLTKQGDSVSTTLQVRLIEGPEPLFILRELHTAFLLL